MYTETVPYPQNDCPGSSRGIAMFSSMIGVALHETSTFSHNS